MTPTVLWIRMFANLLNSVNFFVVAVSLIVFLRRTDIGHRTIIRMGIIFCAMVAGDSALGAWRLYGAYRMHAFVIPGLAFMRLGTAIFGTVMVTYFMVTNRDIIRTLQISELWTRLRNDQNSDSEQARIQMAYVSSETLRKSQALLMKS